MTAAILVEFKRQGGSIKGSRMAVPYKYTTVRLFQLLVIFQVVFSRPNGAPTSSCTSLRPTHGAALTARNPFWLDVRNAANGRLRIQLQSSDRSAFQGFILQARGIVSNAPLGTFTGLPTGSKAMRCTNDGVSDISLFIAIT